MRRLPGLAVVTVAVAAGGGLVLLGATRTWLSLSMLQPPPLSPKVVDSTGASLVPALPALGVVALAGAGALLATRGMFRRVVGALLVAAGLGALALVARAVSSGWMGGVWPALCLVGGCLAAAGGVLALRDGARWPVMGSRYGRGGTGRGGEPRVPAATPEYWDALDRGEDPTA